MIRRHTLAFLFEGQFALLVIILVLSTTSIFTTLRDKSVAAQDRDWKKHVTFPLFLGILNSSGCVWTGQRCFCPVEKLCRTRRSGGYIFGGGDSGRGERPLGREAPNAHSNGFVRGVVVSAFRSCFSLHKEDLMFKSCFDPVMQRYQALICSIMGFGGRKTLKGEPPISFPYPPSLCAGCLYLHSTKSHILPTIS